MNSASEPDSAIPGLGAAAAAALVALVTGWPGVERVRLFGSRARGDHRPWSDVDLAVFGDALTLQGELALRAQISELNLPVDVDIVRIREATSATLREIVEREGKPLRPG